MYDTLFDETQDYDTQRETLAEAVDLARKMAKETPPEPPAKRKLVPGSQTSRILAVLWDLKPHTVPEIHRRAGTSRLNSRISDLRRMGCVIVMTHRAGRKGAGAYSYQMTETPTSIAMPAEHVEWARMVDDAKQRRDAVPRDAAHKFRLYGVKDGDVLDILGSAETEEAIGRLIFSLGRLGQLRGLCLGLLDTHGTDTRNGSWIVNPWEDAR